jgi:hypothetical protein
MAYSKETFLKGIEFLRGLSEEQYEFYRNFFQTISPPLPAGIVVQYPPWGEDPEKDIKPKEFKDFEEKMFKESFENFKKMIEMYFEAYQKFLEA